MSKTILLIGHTLPRKIRLKTKYYCKLCGNTIDSKKAHLINFHKTEKGRLKNRSSNDWVDSIFVECSK